MKRFVFSLQTLLDARQAMEQAAQQRLLLARKAVAEAVRARQNLEARRAEQIAMLEGMQGRVERMSYTSYMRSAESLKRSGILQQEEVVRCEARVAAHLTRLNEEISARQVLEKLREKEQLLWQEEVRTEEQKTMDELGSSRWHMQGKKI